MINLEKEGVVIRMMLFISLDCRRYHPLIFFVFSQRMACRSRDIGERAQNVKACERTDREVFLNLQGDLLKLPEDGGLVCPI